MVLFIATAAVLLANRQHTVAVDGLRRWAHTHLPGRDSTLDAMTHDVALH